MGLFSSDRYFKPGKGVERDEPQKKAFFRFFEVFFRKFWRYILVSLIYSAVLLPVIFYLYAMAYDVVYKLFVGMGFTPEQVENVWTPLLYITSIVYGKIPKAITNAFLVLSILAYGPCRAGVIYVLRNYSQEQHAWVSDIWDKAKENWKQGLLFGLMDIAVFAIAVFNLNYRPENTSLGAFLTASKYLTVLGVLLYSFMRKYIFLMMVTVRLTNWSLLKNSWIMMMIGIFRNVGTGLLNLLLWVGAYLLTLLVHPVFEVLFLPCLLPAFTNFLNVFACYPLVQKYLVEPIEKMTDEEREQLMQASRRKSRKERKSREKDQYYNS